MPNVCHAMLSPMRRVVVLAALAITLTPAATNAQPRSAEASDAPAIQTQRLPNGRMVIQVADRHVTIRKEIAGAASHVVITSPTDELQIRASGAGLTISSPVGSATMGDQAQGDTEQWMAILQRSTAAADARALLSRLPAARGHFGYQSLLLTRAVLDMGSGTAESLRKWAQAQHRPGGVRVIKTTQSSKDDRTISECLEIYSKEAIALWKDYEQCLVGVAWYEVHKSMACATVYTVKAELAMAWVINCVGGLPFVGN